MHSLVTLFLAAFVAAPPTITSNSSALQRRHFVMHESCMRRNPWDVAGRLYDDKVTRAFADARTLSELISTSFEAFYRSTAFTHYFHPDDRREVSDVYARSSWIFSQSTTPIMYSCGSDQQAIGCGLIGPGLQAIRKCAASHQF